MKLRIKEKQKAKWTFYVK